MSRHLHIIMHDVPWPVDFGGVTDLYYKLKCLHESGVKVKLHCFTGQRPAQPLLEKYCETVHYYPRKKLAGISFRLPYIVSSRINDALLKNLLKDDHPVLIEGIHCSYALYADQLKQRKVFLRLHNIEHTYYDRLAKVEKNPWKKFYFLHESRLLKKYESTVASKAPVLAVSKSDAVKYKTDFGADTRFLPVFLPWNDISCKEGKGDYCLYHGNLSVNENEKAAEWLIKNVFAHLKIPFIIAGHAPADALKLLTEKFTHIKLIADPDDNQMQDLIANAQVNVLPSFNSTGVKLKLLNALYNGRHCIVNAAGSEGSGVDELCAIAETPEDLTKLTAELFAENFTAEKMRQRSTALKNLYNSEENIRRLNSWIW